MLQQLEHENRRNLNTSEKKKVSGKNNESALKVQLVPDNPRPLTRKYPITSYHLAFTWYGVLLMHTSKYGRVVFIKSPIMISKRL